MRKLGVTLLVIGFFWLLALQAQQLMHAGIRTVIKSQYVSLDDSTRISYSKQDVEAIISSTASDAFDAQPLFVLPGLISFIGGLLAMRRPSGRATT